MLTKGIELFRMVSAYHNMIVDIIFKDKKCFLLNEKGIQSKPDAFKPYRLEAIFRIKKEELVTLLIK